MSMTDSPLSCRGSLTNAVEPSPGQLKVPPTTPDCPGLVFEMSSVFEIVLIVVLLAAMAIALSGCQRTANAWDTAPWHYGYEPEHGELEQ